MADVKKLKGLNEILAALRVPQVVSFDDCQRLFSELHSAGCSSPPPFQISGNEWCALVNLAVARFGSKGESDVD